MHNHHIVITGGAGYIGSHLCLLLAQQNYQLIIVDRSTDKFPQDLARQYGIVLLQGDCGDKAFMSQIFATYAVDIVIHMAAYIEVGASVLDPYAYYSNNVMATLSLLRCMQEAKINRFIFSSSCAVFGYPHTLPLDEQHSRLPVSPYGNSKYMVELMLEDAHKAYGLQAVIIRYFNAAGASPEHNLGEQHTPETHLIPRLLQAAYQQTPFTLFGTDYPTPDGSCIRDYIHVMDLATAHLKAIDLLQHGYVYGAFNVGAGRGYSVYQLIKAVECRTGKKIVIQHQQRRPGDPPVLVAATDLATKTLAWRPVMSDLETIISSADDFYLKRIHHQDNHDVFFPCVKK